jgi:hypothetical protein
MNTNGHELILKRENAGNSFVFFLCLCLFVSIFAVAQDVPFVESFDSLDSGALHNQNDWSARHQNDAQVESSTVYAGGNAATLGTNTVVWHDFTNSAATNVWVDFYARSSYPTNSSEPSIDGSVAAAFYIDKDGKIRAISNNTWVTLGYTVSSNEWHRFTVNLDYVNEKWSIFAADDTPNKLSTIVATNLAFSASSTNEYFHRFRVKN